MPEVEMTLERALAALARAAQAGNVAPLEYLNAICRGAAFDPAKAAAAAAGLRDNSDEDEVPLWPRSPSR